MKNKLKKLGFTQSDYNKDIYTLWFDVFGVNVKTDKNKIISVEMVFSKSMYNFSSDVNFWVHNIEELEKLINALKIVNEFYPKF